MGYNLDHEVGKLSCSEVYLLMFQDNKICHHVFQISGFQGG